MDAVSGSVRSKSAVAAAFVRRRIAVLRHPGFRRLLAGRAASALGDGLYAVAAMWLVYDLTGSTAYTGLAGFLTQAPGVLKFLVGPLVDRSPLDRVLTLSEGAQLLLVSLVPLAALAGRLTAGVVLAVMPLLALANLFAGPAQTAAIPRLVPEDELVRANSAAVSVTRTVDAAARGLAGAVIAAFGAVACYLLDAVTFVVAAALFASLAVPASDRDADPLNVDRYRDELRDGVGVLSGSVIGYMLVASLFANFLLGATLAVLPAFADAVGGPELYGLLLAGMTVGRVLGSLASAAVDTLPLGTTTIVGFTVAGTLWTAGVLLPGTLATAALFAASRVPVGVYNVSVQATLQAGVPDDLLGRVSAAVGSASSVVLPAGLLLGGVAGTVFDGATVLLAGGGGLFLLAAIWFAIPSLRRFGPPTAVPSGRFA